MDSPLAKIIMIGVAVGLSVAITILAISIFNTAADDINRDQNRVSSDLITTIARCKAIGGQAETADSGTETAVQDDYKFCALDPTPTP